MYYIGILREPDHFILRLPRMMIDILIVMIFSWEERKLLVELRGFMILSFWLKGLKNVEFLLKLFRDILIVSDLELILMEVVESVWRELLCCIAILGILGTLVSSLGILKESLHDHNIIYIYFIIISIYITLHYYFIMIIK